MLSSAWSSNRRDDVLISRLVYKMIITPALLFRFHLIEDGFCHVCKVSDSLEHILFHCCKYHQQRVTCFSCTFLNSISFLLFLSLPSYFPPHMIFVHLKCSSYIRLTVSNCLSFFFACFLFLFDLAT